MTKTLKTGCKLWVCPDCWCKVKDLESKNIHEEALGHKMTLTQNGNT